MAFIIRQCSGPICQSGKHCLSGGSWHVDRGWCVCVLAIDSVPLINQDGGIRQC
jgi:hypothetical protein